MSVIHVRFRPSIHKTIKEKIKNISEVVKACVYLYLKELEFKTRVDQYIQENKDWTL